MADARQTLRNIRIIHLAFLGIPVFLFFLLSTLPIAAKAEPTFLPMVLAVLALGEVGIATTFRGKLIRPAVETLQRSPHDSAALEQWMRGNILSLVFALTVALYGVMIRVMGFSWNIAACFFVAGFLLLLWWTPRMELPVSTNAPAPPPPIDTD